MAKIKKKGASGQAKNFMTRTRAVRKLQISLPDFRRLCIFKGIYPREPRNKSKVSKAPSTTFYYTKDIQYLLHEPLLAKFRNHKALSKKIAKSLGRGEVGDASRLEKASRKVSLDHIIKQRYPSFIDALRDLDDALSLLFLFANLPSTSTVPPKTIALCQKLCHEFQHYIIASHCLQKSFLSIKGIYYQARIQGQDILWLVPYKFVQRVTQDVDFRIMGTFVEFYTTLLGFINFRLYTSMGLVYPPRFDAKVDERGGELDAITLTGAMDVVEPTAPSQVNQEVQKRIDALVLGNPAAVEFFEPQKTESKPAENTEDAEDAEEALHAVARFKADQMDSFRASGDGADILPQPERSQESTTLFSPHTFFLSRETPRQSLEFILRAFGCKRMAWDTVLGDGAFTHDEMDATITHQIVDRPLLPGQHFVRVPGRTYVQPQWVWDCINQGELLRPDQYAPGATLPPHLSPWAKAQKGVYDPTMPLEDQEREGEAEEFAEAEAEAAQIAEMEADLEADQEGNLETTLETQETVERFKAGSLISPEDMDGPTLASLHGMTVGGSESDSSSNFDGFDDADLDESTDQPIKDLHQAELEAEAAGLTFDSQSLNINSLKGILKVSKSSNEVRQKAALQQSKEKEELQRRMGMMGRKKRNLVEKMLYGNKKAEDQAEALRTKRRKLEGSSTSGDGI